jgi:serine/threonine protein kinase
VVTLVCIKQGGKTVEGDFRIEGWLVQPLRDVIESTDGSVQLEPKAMDLLVYLAEHQGEVIPKERLIQAVWTDAFVTDEVLTNNIWKLRQAFGDDHKDPKIIRTVPRRGYQLIAEVAFEEATKDASRYELQKKLGKGAMGEVHLARDLMLGRQVALKFLPAAMEEDESLRRRLVREARAAAGLDQPFICKVYDIGQLEGRTFIAMEYVEGRTLKEKLRRGPLHVDEALHIVAETAEALQTAHDKKIVHRDIKPSNIMLTEQGHVKVMDFGVAKRLPTVEGDQEWTATLTTDASSMGTLPYMSPEQIRGQNVDSRTDIFSLGVVLYEMLTGVHPFRRPISADTAAVTLSEDPPALSRFCKHVPAGLQDLLEKMLAKDRENRYKSIQELRANLSIVSTQKAPFLPTEILKRNKVRLAVTALALVIVTTVTALFLWNPWGTPSLPPLSLPDPLTSSPGIEHVPALSPNGTYVAFTWGEQGKQDIYVQRIGTAEPHPLITDPAGDDFPTWSPDGSQIAFLRYRSETEQEVFVKPVLGDSEERVADSSFVDMGYGSGGLSWSPGEDVIAMVDRTAPDEPNSIFLLSLETREKRRLTDPPSGAWDDWPKFSPDGRTVAFYRFSPLAAQICTKNVRGGDERCLMSTLLFVRGLDWTSDGSAIVVALSKAGSQDAYLVKVPLAGGKPQRLPFGEDADWVSISRTGGRLVYAEYKSDIDLWRASGPKSSETVAPAVFPASSTRNERFPQFSPDGSKVLFVSDRSGNPEIWRCEADGTKLQQLTKVGEAFSGRWSPGGDRIAFDGSEMGDGKWDILVIDENGGKPHNLTSDEFNDGWPSWSADGNWVYYHSNRDGLEICRVPAEGGPNEQLTTAGGGFPKVTEKGQVLFWRENDERIWSLGRGEGGETLVLDQELDGVSWCTWKENIVYVAENENGQQCFEMFNLTSGVTTDLCSLGEVSYTEIGLTVSPDGEWILYTDLNATSDLMLVEGFY